MWRELCQFCLLMLVRPDKDEVLDELQFQLMQIFDKFTIPTKAFEEPLRRFFDPHSSISPQVLIETLLEICSREKDCSEEDAQALYRCFYALYERRVPQQQQKRRHLMEEEEELLSEKPVAPAPQAFQSKKIKV